MSGFLSRETFAKIINPLAGAVLRAGFTPDTVTTKARWRHCARSSAPSHSTAGFPYRNAIVMDCLPSWISTDTEVIGRL